MSRRGALALALLLACGGEGGSSTSSTSPAPREPAVASASPPAPPCACDAPAPPSPAPPLRVRFLGVDGFLLERGADAVMTVPLFTRPSMIEASTGLPVSSDAALVAQRLPPSAVAVRAVLSGHAHYDHLLDAPSVLHAAPDAVLYANVSARNLLAAYAPDRAAKCGGTPAQAKTIARSRVVAVDDPAASTVDYTNCPEQRPPGAPLEGTWMKVPGADVRVLAVCSQHPDQIGPIHYGAGDVDEEACTPPTNMNDWKEGHTVAYLVDFLEPATGKPVYRVFYEDAPTESPVGHVPPKILADKPVDLALMCVGTYDHVDDASPAKALGALGPRFAIGGHWEDFFGALDAPPQPIPMLDVASWATKARAALPAAGLAAPMFHNGAPLPDRAVLPQPGDMFEIR